jgi:hypothetical protein
LFFLRNVEDKIRQLDAQLSLRNGLAKENPLVQYSALISEKGNCFSLKNVEDKIRQLDAQISLRSGLAEEPSSLISKLQRQIVDLQQQLISQHSVSKPVPLKTSAIKSDEEKENVAPQKLKGKAASAKGVAYSGGSDSSDSIIF